MQPGDAMLIGFDLVKPLDMMIDAYDDPTGVTAAFNLNLLGRINRELGGDFDMRAFAHQRDLQPGRAPHRDAFAVARRSERHASRPPIFSATSRPDETIWTESSHKFDADEIPEIARASGFVSEAQWIDQEWPFAENLWRAA